MPVTLGSNIVPKNGQTYYLLEDVYLKGSLQVRKTLADAEAIDANNLKQGQLILVLDESIIYQQTADLTVDGNVPTWEKFVIKADNIDPSVGSGGSGGGGSSGGTSLRKVLIYTTEELTPTSSLDFEVDLEGPTVMVLRFAVSRACRVKVFSSASRDDVNPYEFVATDDKLFDDGTTLLSDGTVLRSRQYSIFVNMDDPVSNKYYFTVANEDDVSGPVVLTLTYLPIEVAVTTPAA